MLKYNILNWCDEKITCLKNNGIEFKNGIPQLPKQYVYDDIPYMVSTFAYRKDIPDDKKSKSLLTYYMFEEKLWPRLNKIDQEIPILKDYAGIVGFDLSPSVGMLRIRQRMSIMINAIHSCYCGIKGIKVLPNYRAGDFGTICAADFFPDEIGFMVGNHGCKNNGFKAYGDYELEMVLRKKRPRILMIYGSVTKIEAYNLIRKYQIEIVTFADRRNRVRNNSKDYHFFMRDNNLCKEVWDCKLTGGVA